MAKVYVRFLCESFLIGYNLYLCKTWFVTIILLQLQYNHVHHILWDESYTFVEMVSYYNQNFTHFRFDVFAIYDESTDGNQCLRFGPADGIMFHAVPSLRPVWWPYHMLLSLPQGDDIDLPASTHHEA